MGEKTYIDGIGFEKTTVDGAVALAEALIKEGKGASVVTPNPEILWQALKDEALAHALKNASLVLPDSVGVRIAASILGDPVPAKVAGVEFGEALVALAAQKGYRVYFLGAKPGVAQKAADNLCEKYPGLAVAGTADGYFKDEEKAVAAVRQSGADILFVCLGAPKQEFFIEKHRHETGAALHLALGGSLDVYAGCVERAPRWMIKLGLEWFFRLCKEPKRAPRMARIPVYLLHCLKIRILGKNTIRGN